MKANKSSQRDKWSSGFGFIMAAAGSAVGLGNLWKFPYMAGTNGGAVFLAAYIFFAAVLGVPILLTELAVGRNGGQNAVDSCRSIAPKWGFAGYFGIAGAFTVLSYYCVVGGWVMKYLASCISDNIPTAEYFAGYTTLTSEPMIWQLLFILVNSVIVLFGISGGIEKVSSVLLPLLIVFLMGIMIYVLGLPGASEGVSFFLLPGRSDLGFGDIIRICVRALGQVFFSLSLGMGTLITYGSYLDKKDDLQKSTVTIVAVDTLIAIICGLTVMPAVFSFGMEPDAGPGLIFSTLPAVFGRMSSGWLISSVFFLLVLFAAVTSAISLFEVIAAFMTEHKGMKRIWAVFIPALCVFALSIPAALSCGESGRCMVMGMAFFDFLVFLSDQIIMPLGGFFLCILAGYKWSREAAEAEISGNGQHRFPAAPIYFGIIRYAAPLLIVIVTVASFIS
ncbi:MAG: sodium-dependent transporter [Huintestinicola sp.]